MSSGRGVSVCLLWVVVVVVVEGGGFRLEEKKRCGGTVREAICTDASF